MSLRRNRLAEKSGGKSFCRTGDDVAADQVTDLGSGAGTGFDGRPYAAHIAADDGRYQSAADVDTFDDFNAGCLYHGIGGFDQCQQSFGFNKPNCLLHVY